MSSHQGAQSDPDTFTGVIAPHLPVGSPERAALFAQFRKTFVEDWEAAGRAVAADRLKAKGGLYFIRLGDAVKIGHTTNIAQRLTNMQVNSPEQIDCFLLLRDRGHEERQWHRRFKADRIRGEWFRWTPELERAVREEREAQRRSMRWPLL